MIKFWADHPEAKIEGEEDWADPAGDAE